MPAQIRPSRLEVTDRFPILSFSVRSSEPGRAEIALATDPSLFDRRARDRRRPDNFFASRASGELRVPRGEAVWIVPADRLAAFAGQPRLYFTLAFAPDSEGQFRVASPGGENHPYVSLAGLSGRSLRTIRILPARRANGADPLGWAGDAVPPSDIPTPDIPGPAARASDPPAYDDGFGPLEEPASEPAAAGPGEPAAARSAAAGQSGLSPAPALDARQVAVEPPPVRLLSGAERVAAEAALLGLSGPYAPFVAALRLAARLSAAAGAPVSIGIGPSVGGGLGAGASLGAGLVFGPGGELGVYGAVQFNIGFITSISATAQVTVVRGGIDRFGGWGLAAAVSAGEGVVGGAAALFDLQGNFVGVSAEVGVGAGFSPVDFYVAVQRQVASQFGMGAALGLLGAGSTGLGAAGPEVEIRYRAFIPAPAVAGPLDAVGGSAYGGDGRDFAYSGGTSRGEITALVRMTPGGGIDSIEVTDARWSPSTAYRRADVQPEPGKPAWWRSRKPGAVPLETASLTRTPENLDVVPGASGTARNAQAIAERASIVSVRATGSNPLVPGAPALDADLAVLLRVRDGAVEAKIVGTHDGFPAHELYVNRHRLVAYDPVAAGGTPWDLADLRGVEVATDWVRVGSPAAGSAAAAPAETFSADIPLDPGTGGMSIGYDALITGDIILSTTDAGISDAIRAMTAGPVSHAMLFVGQGGQVIEAVGEGVRLVPLDRAIADATVAVAFRVPGLSDGDRQRVADEAARLLDSPYNFVGIARQALFQIDRRICDALPDALAARCRRFAGRVNLGTADNRAFFCSQLVLEAYARAGHPLTTEPPHWATPADIAELRFDFARLRYVGHLKAPPVGSLFSLLLSQAAAEPAPAAETAGQEPWSIHWDEIELVPQRHGTTCWAASLAMLIGWRDRVSIPEETIDAAFSRAPDAVGGPIHRADVLAVARALDLEHSEPQTFSAEGFRDLLERKGPVWVAKEAAAGSEAGHAVVVVGMVFDGRDHYVRVLDPWDRVIGTPGAPGPYLATHATGSRYIQRYADFVEEYQWYRRQDNRLAPDQRSDLLQLLHARGTDGRRPNRLAPPPGFAQAASGRADGAGRTRPAAEDGRGAPEAPAAPAAGPDGPDQAAADPAGAPETAGHAASAPARRVGPEPGPRRRIASEAGGARFDLEQYDGLRSPDPAAAVAADPLPAELLVDDWPHLPDAGGRVRAGIRIRWRHAAGAVGDISVVPAEAFVPAGWTVAVRGRIADGPDRPGCAAATVALSWVFDRGDGDEQRATVTVTVRGDGSWERTNAWAADAPAPELAEA